MVSGSVRQKRESSRNQRANQEKKKVTMQSSNVQSNQVSDEILESFLVESKEIVESLAVDLLELEKTPESNDLLNRIFRAAHTIKGSSSFLGFTSITELTHKFEDLLNRLRHNKCRLTPAMLDVLFEASDLLKVLLAHVESHQGPPPDISGIIGKIEHELALEQPDEPVSDPTKASGQTVHDTAASQQQLADTSIRVSINRLDALMNLVGELVLGRNRLLQAGQCIAEAPHISEEMKEILNVAGQIDLITTEMQMAVLKTRMIPIGRILNRIPRMVRDLSKELHKEIDIVIEGQETELDKSIIEELNDPVVHLIRNAADHGIEEPETRVKMGKPAAGIISVRTRNEGNTIVLTIEDDGNGMDPESLRAHAIRRGIVSEAEARALSEREIFDLIFLPGFSMAKEVTNISGRGVGMDVVRTNIAKLKGTIDIHSIRGKGTRFIIKLPLTLAILQALLVKSGSETYAIPLSSVLEVVRTHREDIESLNGREVMRLRDTVLPLSRMDRIFRFSLTDCQMHNFYVVVTGWGEQRTGIVVDSLIGQKDIVVKSLGTYFGNVKGVAGSTILGDGKAVLILDVGQFFELSLRQSCIS